ncbi:MAG: thiamine pyrophosphate-binding protein [Candidatus Tectomicrobia bacterium]|nr:thiamine pyrophosphate-binding protein [Candidatus Tectomicrobia bacterium]
MKRYDALKGLARIVSAEDIVVTSIDGVKREWYSLMPGEGSMFISLLGGPIPFSLGVAVGLPHRRVFTFDTDGSALFNVGALCTLANELPPNLTIVVMDNEQYEGASGHRSHTAGNVDLERLAAGAGIPRTATARDVEHLVAITAEMAADQQVGFVVAKLAPGSFRDFPPGRSKVTDFREDKYRFIRHIERLENISIRPPYVRG